VTAGFYPLTGNPSGFLTASALTPYLTSATAASTYQTLAGMSTYLTKADNLGSLTNFATARDNLGLGSLSTPTFAGVNVPGSGTSVSNLGATSLTINQQGSGQFTIQPSQGIVFPDASVQTTAFTTAQLTAYLVKASNLSDLTSASSARTNLGLGSLALVNDAPSDGSQYARKNGAWDVVSVPASYITSVSSPLSVTTGNLSIDLSAYAPLASPAFTGNPTAPTATFGDNDTSLATTAFVQSALAGGTAVARNLEVEVRNQTGSTIAAGSIVYISGATGNKPLITLAQANNDANSAQTIGFVKTAIANNGTGYVIIRGELENIDTSALTEGVQLYLSPTVAGSWTTTKPSAPLHLVYVGIVIRSHPTLGTILVAVQNGYELNELHDVAIGTLANNDLLAYESSTDLWKNKTFSALGLATQSWVTSQGYLPASTASFTYAALTGATFTGSVNLSSLGVTFFDATTQTTAGISPATAASTYQTISGMSAYAPLASPALTGNVTITSNSTGAALFIEQSGTGNILTLHDQASDTNFVAIDQNGKVSTIPSTTANAGFNVAHGVAPTTPVNGDIWTTTSGLFMRQNGSTKQYVDLDGTQTINGAKTFSGANQTLGNATAAGTINVGTGATISGATKTLNIGTAGVSGSTTNVTVGSSVAGAGVSVTVNGSLTTTGVTQNIGNSTAASTISLGAGATISGSTKSVNIGTSGVAGSTTNIAIGSTTGTSTTTLQGTTNGVTQTAGDSSLKLATTAFVTTADNLKANLASPALTGTPTAPTATPGTNTTQIATTAFVLANAGSGAVWGSITGTLSSQTDLQSALDAKLSTATAASTYQTISGMSSYLTTAAAATTYYPLTGNPSGFLTSAPVTSVAGRTGAITLANTDISGLGTMATAAAADYSTTTVANGLYYPLSSNPAGYLTTAPVVSVAGRTGAITLAVADVSGAAPLASPALSGTPTAPTATPGTNTTQIATTAFVTAAIPSNNVKAWVNFNGGGTPSIRASLNVSSITDNGVGDYTVNMTTALADANFTMVGNCSIDSGITGFAFVSSFGKSTSPYYEAPTTTTARFTTPYAANVNLRIDPVYCNVAIIR
jgi:hypothetical protein